MKYKQRRRLYSQNFLRSPKLVKKLIRNSSIGRNDTVIEIGPGKGIITGEMLKVAENVIAVELDQKLCLYLIKRFKGKKHLQVINESFLKNKLPSYPYKVFSNIPFSITADIVHKLTSSEHLTEAYLIVQKDAAKKFIGMPQDNRNQMMSSLLKPWFDIKVIWEFRRNDFIPTPNVDTFMIKIERRTISHIPTDKKELYKSFTIHKYNRHKVSKLKYNRFIGMFKEFDKKASANKRRELIKHANNILAKQANIHKIHRSRIDDNWKKF